MCGICGVIQIAGDPRLPVEQHVLDNMTDLMVHRGADYLVARTSPPASPWESVALASSTSSPGTTASRTRTGDIWAVQNGELYNHDELRASLEARRAPFRGHGCDTEVLPHLYEQEGDDFGRNAERRVRHRDLGRRQAAWLLARDRPGVKPLYYAAAGDLLVFASELKSLLGEWPRRPGARPRGDLPVPHLRLFTRPARSLRASRRCCRATAAVADGTVELADYWTYPSRRWRRCRGRCRLGARLVDALEDAVRVRLMSDVPLGAMLSGGIDSSVVVALMARNSSRR